MNKPMVSIVIANWNGAAFLADCLDSIIGQTVRDFEIILVDNGSTDASVELVTGRYRGSVRLLRNTENHGFAKANNIGIQQAQGTLIATVNNDAVLDKTWLEEMVPVAMGNARVGMCASKILTAHEPRMIDSVGVNIYPDGMSRQRGWREYDRGQFDRIESILVPSACAAIYKRAMLDEIGLFDEDYFAYCEDTDLGLRGRIAGWDALFVPKARVYHRYSGTSGAYSPFKAYLVERNHYWVALKCFPVCALCKVPIHALYRIAVQGRSAMTYSSRHRQDFQNGRIFAAFLKAHLHAIRSVPRMMVKRRAVWRQRKISLTEYNGLLRRFRLPLNSLKIQ